MDSSTTTPAKKHSRFRKILGVAGAVAAIGIGAMALNPTNAYFSASDKGTIDIKSATLSLDLGDNKGSTNFDLDFTNLKPGEVQSQTYYVTNTGSIPANVKMTGWDPADSYTTAPASFTLADYDELKIGIDGYLSPTPSTQFQNAIKTKNLGALAPGETRAIHVQVGLDSAAGNEWQGVGVGGTLTVTLEQQ